MNIFLSYRREDTAGVTGRIFDRLSARFGRECVFMDVDAIPIGVNFRQHIHDAVCRCHVVLAVIGKDWNPTLPQREPRLNQPTDFVRIELETAFSNQIPVIPLLIGQTTMPGVDTLPKSLQELTDLNAARVDMLSDFHPHMDRLIAQLAQAFFSQPQAECQIDQSVSHPEESATIPTICLRISHANGESENRVLDISKDRRIMLGRDWSCDVVLENERWASGRHAMVIYDHKHEWMIEDLSSTNGLFLNGSRISIAKLKVNDQIQIGQSTIWIEWLTAAPMR